MAQNNLQAWISWDPDPTAFVIPYFDHPVRWYGLLFVTGFFLGFFILLPLVRQRLNGDQERAYPYVDGLVWFLVLGTVIGARLGHVFIYEWPRYRDNWPAIFRIWEGGLASHGGTLGVMLALYCYARWRRKAYPEISFLALCDLVSVPTALTAMFIRLGNFVNQEILGTVSQVPWAIIFASPGDGSAPLPRHPVQLYEALAYFATFCVLYCLQKRAVVQAKPGYLTGVFFVLVFGSRFVLEFFKTDQGGFMETTSFQSGQLLSLPFIALGLYLMLSRRKVSPVKKGQRNVS